VKARTVLALSLVVLISCAFLSLLVWDRPNILISSDTLLPAEFVWDVLHHSYAWRGFQQARVPSFFPDLLIYGVIQAVTSSWRIAMAAWVFLVLVWLVTIASWITTRITRSTNQDATLSVLLLVVMILTAAVLEFPRFTAMDSYDDLHPYLFILMPFTHGGPFLLALTAAAIASRAIEQGSARRTIVLTLISFAAGISDLLWFTAFQIPLTAAATAGLSVGTIAKRTAIRLLACVWGSGVLGWACTQTFDREPLPLSVLYTVPSRIGWFLRDLWHHPGMLIIVAAFVLAAASDARRRGFRGWLGSFWPVFATTSALGSLAMTMLLYEGMTIYRYALPFLWWTVIFAAAALAQVACQRPMLLRLAAAAIVPGLALAYLANGVHEPRLFGWASALASCLQSAGLRTGLADYWSARPINAASDWQLQVEQISETGGARVWGNDRRWYTHDIHDASRRPAYRFIVMDGLPADRIAAAYGQPDRMMGCGSSTVWVYNDSERFYSNLVRASSTTPKLFVSAPAN
jgi:hypothetical protein